MLQRHAAALSVVAAAVAAVLPFAGALQGYFLSDDFGLIWLLWDKPAAHFLSLFTAPWTENIYGYRADEIRPTLAFSYWLDAQWGPANPVAYHVTSVLLHVANTLLVLALARRVASLPWQGAGFAAVLFGLMPVHAETVVWISGRADSLPALFMLTTLLAFSVWRAQGGPGWYLLSLTACFLALFTKQSAIMLPALLVGVDLALRGVVVMHIRALWLGYLPFAALAVGYLLLRLALFGNAVREDSLGAGLLGQFLARQPTYLLAAFTGLEQPVWSPGVAAAAVGAAGLGAAGLLGAWQSRRTAGAWMAKLWYFGPAWWVLTVGPLAVVGYFTARHLYLTSAGIAIALGWLLVITRRGAAASQLFGLLSAAALLCGSSLLLQSTVGAWDAAGRFSRTIAEDLSREIAGAPEGALLVIGAPPTGDDPALRTWLWGFSVPFALQPPFARAESLGRVRVVTRPEVHCCAAQWPDQVRKAVEAWRAAPGRPPVVVLGWDAASHRLLRSTDAADPEWRRQAEALAGLSNPGELSGAVDAMLNRLGAGQVKFRLN